jgi:hypothetical protein
MRRKTSFFAAQFLGLIAVVLISGISIIDCLAVTTVTVTPSTFTLGDTTTSVTIQANTAAAGNALMFDVCIDVDGDGVLDPVDGRFMSFEIVDGQGPRLGNEYYWHDEDGATNSAIRATLTAHGAWWFSGHFILKVTDDDSSTATTSFAVEQDSSHPCLVTGEVQFEGSPAGGAIVTLLDVVTEGDVSMALAAADGTFELRAKSPGEYAVYAMQVGAVTKYEQGSGQMLTVLEGANPLTDPLVVFPANHTISGRAFASDTGEGFPGLLIFGETETFFTLTVTDDEGDYSLVVVDGEWQVSVEESQIARLGYVPAEARSATVSGSNVTGIGLMCEGTTTLITGTVKDAETQQGLDGIALYAQMQTGGDNGGPEVIAYTAADGTYKIGVIEGEWWVDVDNDCLVGTGYADPPGRLINAPASGTVTGIDFLLQKGGEITGQVYQDDGVTPIEEASVEAHDFQTGDWVAYAKTLPDGSYTLSVPSGTYKVNVFWVEGWLDQYYLNAANWEEATPVVVTAPGETSGINFVLQPAAYIIGHVYEDDGATPIEGANVEASVFGPSWQWVASDETEADGSFRLTLPEGTYKVLCRDVPGWLNQFYNRVGSDDQASPVVASGGQETPGIDFVLQPAATITGHVYQEGGTTPLPGAWVSAIDATTDEWIGGPATGDDGSYSITVPSGSYRVWADAERWVGEYYDDAHTYAAATVVTVVAPQQRSGVDFALTEATATIKGYVYQEDGTTPLVGASVTALEYATDDAVGWAQSGADGSYTLPVPPGAFRVNAWAHHYSFQYYDHRQYHDATRVTLSGSQTVENVNFSLQWIPLVISEVRESVSFPGGADVQWSWVPGMRYSVYWAEEMNSGGAGWHEVSDPSPDIVQEGSNGGWMTWTDKGTSPGMNGKPPGDSSVRQRFYKVKEEPE